ncbi:MAG: DUF2752 domain-containing protein [Planctomycetes bacterium]|nr:DUF2752 domain-containing protein [Planctomycetota bacterium]
MTRGAGHWTVVGLSIAALLALVSLRWLTTPDPLGHGTHEQLGLAPCWSMVAWNFPCPGCGVTTAASQWVHGDFAGALATQPFGVLSAILVVCGAVGSLAATVLGRDAWEDLRRLWRGWMGWALVAALLAAWIYKYFSLRA